MDAISAQRTLVKSPPELWSRLSDAEALARHLGEFGEIRITSLEAERTVVWEGDRARGTVELEPSGWGTKVTLTAESVGSEEAEAEPAPELTLESAALEVPVPDPAPDPDPGPRPDPAPVPVPGPDPEPAPPRKPRFFARLFGRRRPPTTSSAVADDESPVGRDAPADGALGPAATVAGKRASAQDSVPLAERSSDPINGDLEPMVGNPDPAGDDGPAVVGAVTAAPEAESEKAAAILETVLDDLGAAHHRPFSRG